MLFLRKTCCCCLNLRYGTISVSIICLFSIVVNIYIEARMVTSHKDTLKSYPNTPSTFNGFIRLFNLFIYGNLVVQALGVIAAIMILIPSCTDIKEESKSERQYLIPFIVWCCLALFYSVVFMIVVRVNITELSSVINRISLNVLQVGVYSSIPIYAWSAFVVASYHRLLKENNERIVHNTTNVATIQNSV